MDDSSYGGSFAISNIFDHYNLLKFQEISAAMSHNRN